MGFFMAVRQVEHPVTENIMGLNLPACQLQVAMGVPLHRIGDIRRMYGRNPRGNDTIDFDYTERAVAPRHCIAVRVTAENPEAGFQPSSGVYNLMIVMVMMIMLTMTLI